MTVRLEALEESWRFSEPIRCPRRYMPQRGFYDIVLVRRTEHADRDIHWSFHGWPVTTKGTRNGGMDYRSIPEEDEQRIIALVEAVRS